MHHIIDLPGYLTRETAEKVITLIDEMLQVKSIQGDLDAVRYLEQERADAEDYIKWKQENAKNILTTL